MILMGLVTMGIVFGMPYLMENSKSLLIPSSFLTLYEYKSVCV